MLHRIRPREIIRQRNRRLKLMALAILLASLGGLLHWWLNHRGWVSTDDAFVAGHLITLKAQTDGAVIEVLTENTRHVQKGDVLIKLDGSHALIALQQAKAELAEAVRDVVTLQARVEALKQRVNAKQAALSQVRHDLSRFKIAAKDGAASAQQMQNTQDKITEIEASIRETRAERLGVIAQLRNSKISDHPSVESAKSRVRRAFLDYERRKIVAPVSGYVAKRSVQVGDSLKAGSPLLVIVPLDQVWVEANFLETQAADIQTGQLAEIRVDAYGNDKLYHGRVLGINPATGSQFALLPTDNSTGNFIHIAERLQVRIALDAAELRAHPLQPGLSTLTRVNISEGGPIASTANDDLDHDAYRTDIYDHEMDGATKLIENIISKNGA
ncbi:MAG: efflux RND transporter periplasmic adaptor subunit [Gammaproteobacteria bacterium]